MAIPELTDPKYDFVRHNADEVYGFFGKYRFLSNFHPADVWFEGLLYPSAEHAYQAAKCIDREFRATIRDLTTGEAKRVGKNLHLRRDWEAVKDHVMRGVVFEKFLRNFELREMLVETGDRKLTEANYWGDRIWGVYNGGGENRLGRILEKTRAYWS